MKPITNEQVRVLREEIRPFTHNVELDKLSVILSAACDHEELSAGCKMCRLWRLANSAAESWNIFVEDLDRVLSEGPNPK